MKKCRRLGKIRKEKTSIKKLDFFFAFHCFWVVNLVQAKKAHNWAVDQLTLTLHTRKLLVYTNTSVFSVALPLLIHNKQTRDLLTFSTQRQRLKREQVVKNRGQYSGDVGISGYLDNTTGPVSVVMDLRIVHDRVGSSRHVRYHLWLLLVVRLGGYIENLSDFYSYRIIGKLTVFL